MSNEKFFFLEYNHHFKHEVYTIYERRNVMKYLNGKIPIARLQKYTKVFEPLCLNSFPYELWNAR